MADEPFTPDWVSPPGDTIQDIMDQGGLLKLEVAQQIGLSLARFENLLIGGEKITPEIAKKLSEVLGASVRFWLRREKQYRADRARLGI